MGVERVGSPETVAVLGVPGSSGVPERGTRQFVIYRLEEALSALEDGSGTVVPASARDAIEHLTQLVLDRCGYLPGTDRLDPEIYGLFRAINSQINQHNGGRS